jgi:nitroreductase
VSNNAAKALLAQMCARSHVAPKRLEVPGPTTDELNLIFNAAAQAPDHGNIQPWRFILVPQEKRAALVTIDSRSMSIKYQFLEARSTFQSSYIVSAL